MPRRALLIFEASPLVGAGHMARCLTLASALEPTCLVEIASNASATTFPIMPRPPWAVCFQDGRSDQILQHLPRTTAPAYDLAVVDHYSIGASFERSLRTFAKRIFVIDDLANREHDCDILLDQTYGREVSSYRQLVPANCCLLLGSRYALLRPEYAALRARSLLRRRDVNAVERILISLGQADVQEITTRVLASILTVADLKRIDVAIPAHIRDRAHLESIASAHQNVRLHIGPSHISQLMADADLAIGAAGSSAWERCCLGLPTIMLVLADNQHMIASQLARAGAAIELSDGPQFTERLATAVAGLANNPPRLLDMSNKAARITDGNGAKMVTDALISTMNHAGLADGNCCAPADCKHSGL